MLNRFKGTKRAKTKLSPTTPKNHQPRSQRPATSQNITSASGTLKKKKRNCRLSSKRPKTKPSGNARQPPAKTTKASIMPDAPNSGARATLETKRIQGRFPTIDSLLDVLSFNYVAQISSKRLNNVCRRKRGTKT